MPTINGHVQTIFETDYAGRVTVTPVSIPSAHGGSLTFGGPQYIMPDSGGDFEQVIVPGRYKFRMGIHEKEMLIPDSAIPLDASELLIDDYLPVLFPRGMVNILAHGASPDREDNAECFAAAIAAAASIGAAVFVPPVGTFMASRIECPEDISIYGLPGSKIKQCDNPTGHLFEFTTASTGIIQGIEFIGADIVPASAENWFALLKPNCNGLRVRDCIFRGFALAGIYEDGITGDLFVERCKFLDGREHGGTLGLLSCGVSAFTSGENIRARVIVRGSDFIQSETPSEARRGPGGVILAGAKSANSFISAKITGCHFKRIGQSHAGNHIGAVDFYQDIDGGLVAWNTFEDTETLALKLQSSSNWVACYNIIQRGGDGALCAILIDPSQKTTGNTRNAVVGNQIRDYETTAILLLAATEDTADALISKNIITNCAAGIKTLGTGEHQIGGHVTISGNEIYLSTTNAKCIDLNDIVGTVLLESNKCFGTNGHGIFGTLRNGAGALVLKGNHCETTGGYYPIRIDAAAKVIGRNNTTSMTGGAVAAVRLQGNGTDGIQVVDWDGSNKQLAGALSIDFAAVAAMQGTLHYSGDPGTNGVKAAAGTCLYFRTDTPALYIKQQFSSSSGWKQLAFV